MDSISFFYIGLILLVGCFLAGAVLSFRLKRMYPHICLEIGRPPATAWYPFWVLPLLRKRHFDLLNSAERLVVVFISLGLLLGMALLSSVSAKLSLANMPGHAPNNSFKPKPLRGSA